MKYSHIIAKLFSEPALVTPQRHAAICKLLDARLQDLPSDEPGPVAQPEPEIVQVGQTVIIPVHGTIVRYPEDIAMSECGCDLETVDGMIDAAENDPTVQTVVYDFRSPGGSATGIPETGRKILNSNKQTVAFTASECCSGAIWLAEQCQQFYATQSAVVGSVGVYCMCIEESRALDAEGITVNAIYAGKYKLLGAYFKPMTDEERAIIQAKVDKLYAQFKAAMTSYRQISAENYGNGLTFDGDDAAAFGFTDGVVENIQEAIEAARSALVAS